MGPQGGAEMRTKQTSDIILFNINFFFFFYLQALLNMFI